MRMLSKLFRMFSSGGGRTNTGRRGTGRSRGTASRSSGGIGSMIRRFLR